MDAALYEETLRAKKSWMQSCLTFAGEVAMLAWEGVGEAERSLDPAELVPAECVEKASKQM